MIKKFEEYLVHEKRFSDDTVKAYSNDISQFSGFLKSRGIENFSLVRPKDIRQWVVDYVESGYQSASIQRKLSTVKVFYQFALRNGQVESNPAKNINAPRLLQRLPKFVEESRIDSMFSNMYSKDMDFRNFRDLMVLEILYGIGVRRRELVNLRWGDMDESLKQVRIVGKGRKERRVPLGGRLIKLLGEYREVYERELGLIQETDFVIVSDKGLQAYPGLIYKVVNKIMSEAGVKLQKSPHVLRHTFATHMANHGAPLNDIKELLGHSSLASTQIYTHNTIERLKEIFKQSHPKA